MLDLKEIVKLSPRKASVDGGDLWNETFSLALEGEASRSRPAFLSFAMYSL
jgi:hypothetical protein